MDTPLVPGINGGDTEFAPMAPPPPAPGKISRVKVSKPVKKVAPVQPVQPQEQPANVQHNVQPVHDVQHNVQSAQPIQPVQHNVQPQEEQPYGSSPRPIQPPPRRELGGPGLVPGFVQHAQNFLAKAPQVQYASTQPQYHPQQPQYAPNPQVAPSTGTSGLRIGAMGFSLASGLFPIPLNPLFFPIQMVAFIIIIIILLVNGWSFWTSALIAWIVPAMFAAVAHYMLIGGVLSMFGRGEDEKNVVM